LLILKHIKNEKNKFQILITLLVAVVISATTSVTAQRGNGGWGKEGTLINHGIDKNY